MQVARLYDFGDIRVEESATPEVGPDEILVRVRACGICSGDIMPWYIRRKAPLVLGHEPVGVVEQAGAAVRDFRPANESSSIITPPASIAPHAAAANTSNAIPGAPPRSPRAGWPNFSSSVRPTSAIRSSFPPMFRTSMGSWSSPPPA